MNNKNFKTGDRYFLKYCGKKYPYVVKKINNNLYLVHDSNTPLGEPLTAIPVEEYDNYDKEYGLIKVKKR